MTVVSANLNIAFAIESYLQLRSANVNYHNGDIDVDIHTGGNIPSEKDNSGFGYAVLTDVGDEFVDNMLVAISDIGIKNYDKSTKNDKLHTYALDLKGDISRACSSSDYEVAKSSSDNEAFDTDYRVDIKGNKISIDDIDTNDLASGTVKAIASFTAESITQNGKIKHICIDIQDVLKQSEISTSYNTYNNDGNGDDDDDHEDNSRHNDNEKNRKDHDDDKTKKDDNHNDDDLFEIVIDQDIDQSNECDGEASCSNEANNEANVGDESSGISDSDGFDLDLDQDIDQSNECSDGSTCNNEGSNEANFWENSDGRSDSNKDISQSIEQSNECDSEASCSNEGTNEANVLGSISDYGDFDSDVDIDQSIEQSNACSGGSICSNFASNVVNIG
jgi:hypothetical protein